MTLSSKTSRYQARWAMDDVHDRRKMHRVDGEGLMLRIDRLLVEVRDVSLGGVRIDRLDLPQGEELKMQLIPRDGRKVLVDQSLPVVGVIVGHCEKWTSIRFEPVSYKLAKFLVKHMSDKMGVPPFIVK